TTAPSPRTSSASAASSPPSIPPSTRSTPCTAWDTGGRRSARPMRLRLSLRLKLALVALVLLALPWAGYEYVREMERFLLEGQEQALLATARAIATGLHDRPGLMTPRAEREADPRLRAEEELKRIAAGRGGET